MPPIRFPEKTTRVVPNGAPEVPQHAVGGGSLGWSARICHFRAQPERVRDGSGAHPSGHPGTGRGPRLDATDAFGVLRRLSQTENVKLREIASRIVDTGQVG